MEGFIRLPSRRPAHDVISHSPDQSRGIGFHLGRLVRPGDLILLSGRIGSGKTTLVQGLAAGLQIEGYVQSPTFTLAVEHAGRTPEGTTVTLFHIDLYRLEDSGDLATFGLDEYLDAPDGITVVEWPERLPLLAAENYLLVELEHIADTKRRIAFRPHGGRYEELVDALRVEVFGARHRGSAAGN